MCKGSVPGFWFNKFTSSQLFFVVTLSCSHIASTGEREMQLFQGLSTPPKPLSFCEWSLWKLSKVKLCRLNKKSIKTWGWRRLVLLNKTRVQEVYEKYIGTNVWHTGSPVRYVLKIHFFIESARKMIQFKIQFKTKSKIFIQKNIHSKQNPKYSFKKIFIQ